MRVQSEKSSLFQLGDVAALGADLYGMDPGSSIKNILIGLFIDDRSILGQATDS